VDDDLGVALGAEAVAQRLELGHEFLEVVDLAVKDDADAAVLVEKRLLAGGDVDDRQAAVAKAQARLDVQAAFVGAAVVLRIVHSRQRRAVDRTGTAGIEEAGDAAHRVVQSFAARFSRSS